jgi:hypothetical protein
MRQIALSHETSHTLPFWGLHLVHRCPGYDPHRGVPIQRLWLRVGGSIPSFTPDMGELLGISEPVVTHHHPQRGQAGGGEEQARQPAACIERDEPAVKQALRCRSQFWLAGARSGLPGPQHPSATVGSVVK